MLNQSWKGYPFAALNLLDEEEYIYQGSYRSKSVVLTAPGMEYAKRLLDKYQIEDWEE